MDIVTKTTKLIANKVISETHRKVSRRLATIHSVKSAGTHDLSLQVILLFLDGTIGGCFQYIWRDDDPDFGRPYDGPRRVDLYIGRLVEYECEPQEYGCREELRLVDIERIERSYFGV